MLIALIPAVAIGCGSSGDGDPDSNAKTQDGNDFVGEPADPLAGSYEGGGGGIAIELVVSGDPPGVTEVTIEESQDGNRSSQTLDVSIAIEEGSFEYFLPVPPSPIEISGTFVDDGRRVVGRLDLGQGQTDWEATNFAARGTDPAAAEAVCSADEAWIEAEEAAYAAYDAEDLDKADSLVTGDVKDAFVSWREALVGAGISGEVAAYVAGVEEWFKAAEADGIEGYDKTSADQATTGPVNDASTFYLDWKRE